MAFDYNQQQTHKQETKPAASAGNAVKNDTKNSSPLNSPFSTQTNKTSIGAEAMQREAGRSVVEEDQFSFDQPFSVGNVVPLPKTKPTASAQPPKQTYQPALVQQEPSYDNMDAFYAHNTQNTQNAHMTAQTALTAPSAQTEASSKPVVPSVADDIDFFDALGGPPMDDFPSGPSPFAAAAPAPPPPPTASYSNSNSNSNSSPSSLSLSHQPVSAHQAEPSYNTAGNMPSSLTQPFSTTNIQTNQPTTSQNPPFTSSSGDANDFFDSDSFSSQPASYVSAQSQPVTSNPQQQQQFQNDVDFFDYF